MWQTGRLEGGSSSGGTVPSSTPRLLTQLPARSPPSRPLHTHSRTSTHTPLPLPLLLSLLLQRNYRYFLLFVSSTALLCIWVIAFCLANLLLAARDAGWSFSTAVSDHPAALVCAVYTFVGFWFVGGLTVFHSYLVATNQTTYEHFRHRYSGGGPWGLEGDGESSGGLAGWLAGLGGLGARGAGHAPAVRPGADVWRFSRGPRCGAAPCSLSP